MPYPHPLLQLENDIELFEISFCGNCPQWKKRPRWEQVRSALCRGALFRCLSNPGEGGFRMKKLDVKTMVTCAVLIAAAIVLSRFLSINAWNLKIGFTFVPVFLAAYLYGPLGGAIVGGIADFLGATLFPIGAYFPGFTLTCVLTGIVYGLLLHKKQTPLRILIAVGIVQLICGLLINTYWISVLYGSPFEALLVTRTVQCLIMIPVEFIVIGILSKSLARYKSVLTRVA